MNLGSVLFAEHGIQAIIQNVHLSSVLYTSFTYSACTVLYYSVGLLDPLNKHRDLRDALLKK